MKNNLIKGCAAIVIVIIIKEAAQPFLCIDILEKSKFLGFKLCFFIYFKSRKPRQAGVNE